MALIFASCPLKMLSALTICSICHVVAMFVLFLVCLDVNNNSNGINGDAMTNGISNNKALNRMSTYSAFGNNMSQVSPTSATSLDPAGRAKSREFLRM